MNFLRIAKEDIKGILKNRFIRVSIIAIIIVPLLYSLLYLYAFWDPYSRLEDIHVAVVNNDKGTVMDGERVNYGKDVEEELRNNNEIGWTITSEEEANSGLEGKGYYAKVVIPEDFSEKVTSAKEGKPERAKIQFVTNDKKNFLAAQINSKVESELKGKITSKISSNYIEVAFDSLYEAKDGLTQAADGSKQLQDGLSTLNDKVPELANGANKLSDGSSQLLNGQVALNNGINEVSNGSQALNDGLSQLYGKVPTLSNGVAALSNGASNLSNGVTELNNGASDLSKGISTANSGSKQIADGSKALYNAYTSTIYPSVGQLKNGANQLNDALNAGGADVSKLSAGATEIANKSDDVSSGYNEIYNGVNTLVSGVLDSANANANVMELLSKAASETDVNVKNNLINQALQITQAVSQKSQASAPEVQKLLKGNSDFKAGLDQYTQGSKALANGTTSLISKVGQVQQGVGQLNSGLNQLSAGLDPSTSEFGIGLKTIADSTANLSNGLNTINTGASQLNTGVSQLSTGANKLNEGANELNSNIPALSTGITDLYNGSTALANGTKELSSGSNKLVDGQKQLNSGITELTSAVPELTDGVNKLYDGSKELSDKLGEGADKLKNGLVNSAKDMGEFASQAINMNSEAINKIPNYGTGFAPYFMPLSLWIGAIMMFFVIPSKLKDEENLSNFDMVAGKYLSYAFVGILQAILVSTVVLMLGLKPTNIGVYYLTNIFLSLVFVAIVQCFISLFGDAGRLLSIILLILQLTACAGTFPLEVLPKFFKTLYPFMPFTYAVQALREVISADIINYSIVRKDLLILGLMLVIFLAISISLKKVGEKITSSIEGRKSDVAV